jgi:hypothetical protein
MMTSSSSFFAAGGAASAVVGEETGAESFGFAEGDSGTPTAGLAVDAPVAVTDRGDPTGDFDASAAVAPVPFCAPTAAPFVEAAAAARGVMAGDFVAADCFLEEEAGDVGATGREDDFVAATAAGRGEFDKLVAAAAALEFFAVATGLFGVVDAAGAAAGIDEEALAPVEAAAGAAAGGKTELAALGAAAAAAVAAEVLAGADAAGEAAAAAAATVEDDAGLAFRAATA